MQTLLTTTLALTGLAIPLSLGDLPSDVMANVDKRVHPCENFYQYSCGKWLDKHQLTASESSLNVMDTIRAKNVLVFEQILEAKHPFLSEFWDSCMAIDKISDRGNKPLQKDLNHIVKAKTSVDVLTLAGEFFRTGTNAFIKLSKMADEKDASLNTLLLTIADLTLPSLSYYSNDKQILKDYRQYIKDVMELSGFSLTDGKSVADTVIEIEKKIAMMHRISKKEISPLSIAKSREELPITFDAFAKGVGLFSKTNVKGNLKIYIKGLKEIKTLETWLRSFSVDAIKKYVAFVMVHSRIPWLGKDFQHVWFKFFGQSLRGQAHAPDRYSTCMHNVLKYVPDLIGKYYYKKAFDSKREKHATEMTKLIQEALKNRITNAPWMIKDDKDQAKKKLNNVMQLIGQPTISRPLPPALSRVDYPSNLNRILSHTFDFELKKIGQRGDRMDWHSASAGVVNAFYSKGENKIILPAGILQAPLFNGSNFHPARNFGGIGTIMGHELTHGFDNLGRNYDENGNLHDWWGPQTTKGFKDLAFCFENQYDKFRVYGHNGKVGKVDGHKALDENIAENSGLALAWDAYRNYIGPKPEIDGVTATEGDKLFFITYAQSWCMNEQDKMTFNNLAERGYPPAKWRVNGAVMNHEHFGLVFGCRANEPMNPNKKCRVW